MSARPVPPPQERGGDIEGHQLTGCLSVVVPAGTGREADDGVVLYCGEGCRLPGIGVSELVALVAVFGTEAGKVLSREKTAIATCHERTWTATTLSTSVCLAGRISTGTT
jgi:hypothetical protein